MKIITTDKIKNNLTIITDFNSNTPAKPPFWYHWVQYKNLEKLLKKNDFSRISVFTYNEDIYDSDKNVAKFYNNLFKLKEIYKFKLNIHTSFEKPNEFLKIFDKIVIEVTSSNYRDVFENWSSTYVPLRFVYHANVHDLDLIQNIIRELPTRAQLTIKQLDSISIDKYLPIIRSMKDYDNIYFLPTGDYNIYYSLGEKDLFFSYKTAFKL